MACLPRSALFVCIAAPLALCQAILSAFDSHIRSDRIDWMIDFDSIRMMPYDAIFGLLFQEMSNFQDHNVIIFSYSGASQQPCSVPLYLESTSSLEKSRHATYAEADSILHSYEYSEAVKQFQVLLVLFMKRAKTHIPSQKGHSSY